MRLGIGRGGLPPHKMAGYTVMGLGGLVMLLSLPLYFWSAVVGGALGVLGYTIQQQR